MAEKFSATPFGYDQNTTDDWSPQLGQWGFGPDEDSLAGVITRNTVNGRRTYVLVQNASGGTLAAGQALQFTSTFYGRKVTKSAIFSAICGFAPPAISGSITNTIPNLAYFWMVKEGFTSVLKDASALVEKSQIEASATAGQVKANAGSAYSGTLAGTAIEANAGASSLTRAYVNCQW